MGNEVDSVKVVISGDADGLKKEVESSQKVLNSFGKNFKSVSQGMSQSFVSLSAKAKAKFSEIKNDVNKAVTAMKDDMAKGSASANSFGKIIKSVFSIAAIKYLISFCAQTSATATSLESSQRRVQEIFGQSSSAIQYFAENSAQSLGISAAAAYEYAATYGNLFLNFTSSSATNSVLTQRMLNASAVVASKTGRTIEDVMERIRSGLLGNTEAIEDLGINVNVAMLETTEAFKKMADGRSWEQLTYQEQQQIRTLAILEQAQNKYGNEVAQSSALTKAQASAAIEDFKASVGTLVNQLLIPALPVVTKFFNGLSSIASALSSAGTPAKTLLGISAAFLGVLLASMAATKIYAVIIKGVAAVKIVWAAVTGLLIPKIITLGSVLKAALGWIGIIAGVVGLFTALSDSADTTETDNLENVNDIVNNTADSANEATSAVNSLEAGLEDLSETAKGLAGFDKINKLSSSTSGTSSGLGGSSGNLLDNYIDDIINSQELVANAIMPSAETTSTTKKAWNNMLEDVFSGDWSTFWSNWKSGAGDIKNNVVSKIRSTHFGNAALNMFSDLFKGDWKTFWGNWKSGASTIKNNTVSKIKSTHFGNAALNMFSDLFKGDWKTFWGNWKSGAGTISNNINQKIWGVDTTTVNNSAKNLFSDIFEGNWSTFWKNWKSGSFDILNNINLKIWGVNTSTLKTAFTNMLEDVFSGGWDNFWENWKDGITEIFNSSSGTDLSSSSKSSKKSLSISPRITAFATGGVIESPTVGLVGEAGREAIMPLENNNGWIREIALEQARYMASMNTSSSGSGNTNVYIGNDKLDSYVVRSQNRRNKRGGGR